MLPGHFACIFQSFIHPPSPAPSPSLRNQFLFLFSFSRHLVEYHVLVLDCPCGSQLVVGWWQLMGNCGLLGNASCTPHGKSNLLWVISTASTFLNLVKEVGQMGTMVRHNTQNRPECCHNCSPYKTMLHKGSNFPCSMIITHIAPCRRRRSSVPLGFGRGGAKDWMQTRHSGNMSSNGCQSTCHGLWPGRVALRMGHGWICETNWQNSPICHCPDSGTLLRSQNLSQKPQS